MTALTTIVVPDWALIVFYVLWAVGIVTNWRVKYWQRQLHEQRRDYIDAQAKVAQ